MERWICEGNRRLPLKYVTFTYVHIALSVKKNCKISTWLSVWSRQAWEHLISVELCPTCVNSNSCYINHALYDNIPHETAMFFDDESFKWDSVYDSQRAYASVRLMLILSAHVTLGQ